MFVDGCASVFVDGCASVFVDGCVCIESHRQFHNCIKSVFEYYY